LAENETAQSRELGSFRRLKDHSKAFSPENKTAPTADDNLFRSLTDQSKTLSADNEISLARPIFQRSRSDFSLEEKLVFICYSRKDQDFTLKLARAIKARGVRVWIDQWDIPAGADWDLSIDEGLSKCDRLLIVLSPTSVKSRHVRSELHTAFDDEMLVVPVLYQTCKIPRELKMIQCFDFTSVSLDDEEKMGQLLRDLRAQKK